jgi:hypothetical protein
MITKMRYLLIQKSEDGEDRVSIVDDPVAVTFWRGKRDV